VSGQLGHITSTRIVQRDFFYHLTLSNWWNVLLFKTAVRKWFF